MSLPLESNPQSEQGSQNGDEGEEPLRYPGHWDETTWEKDLETHPIFMTAPPENPTELPPLLEAIRQLKYDETCNGPKELAEMYKKDGNENFRLKKYRWAIDSYTTGLKQKCDDDMLNSMLYGNRAAAHARLGNYRSAVKDCQEAIKLNPRNEKAVERIAECLFKLKDYRECVDFCRKHVLDYSQLEEFITKSLKELSLMQEKIKEEQEKERKVALHQQSLITEVDLRGIRREGNLFESFHPAAMGTHVQMDEERVLYWPVIFLYPEYSQSDFIQSWREDVSFEAQLECLFGDESNLPPWDTERKYRPGYVKVAYPDSLNPNQMIPVDVKSSLKDLLCSPNFLLAGANPTFSVVSFKK